MQEIIDLIKDNLLIHTHQRQIKLIKIKNECESDSLLKNKLQIDE